MRIVIIEDEPAAANQLIFLLNELAIEHEIVAVIDSVSGGINWFTNNAKHDLIFSDIQLADGLSFEIFEQIQMKTPIIFTTAFDEYAIKAFKLNSIDYILKPIDLEAVRFAVEKFQNQQMINQDAFNTLIGEQAFYPKSFRKSFLVNYRNKLLPIKTTDFSYFFIENGIVFGQLIDGRKFSLDFKLEDLENQLNPQDFVRANRQFIISRSSIFEIEPYFNSRIDIKVKPQAPVSIIVSKERVTFLKNWFERF